MRTLFVILGLVAVVGVLAGIKYKQIASLIHMGEAMQKSGPPPETVSTAVAHTDNWEGTLQAIGSITGAKGVSISNDSPGVVTRIAFESGQVVREGQVLVELDTSVERAQLASAQARLALANQTAGRSRALIESKSIAQSTADADEAALKAQTTDVEGLNAQIARKVVKAPFGGRLGIRQVNLGQYLNSGTTLTVLEAIETVYADFTLPQQRLPDVKVGTPVRVALEGAKVVLDGQIAAIDPTIDASTRSIKVRASVPNKEEKLRPGMFATISVVLPKSDAIITAPVTAVIHAPYGDSVFVVEPKKGEDGKPVTGADGKPALIGRQQFVRTGDARGDYVALLEGVKDGDQLVTEGAFKLRNGSPITINNDVGPKPSLDPQVKNR